MRTLFKFAVEMCNDLENPATHAGSRYPTFLRRVKLWLRTKKIWFRHFNKSRTPWTMTHGQRTGWRETTSLAVRRGWRQKS